MGVGVWGVYKAKLAVRIYNGKGCSVEGEGGGGGRQRWERGEQRAGMEKGEEAQGKEKGRHWQPGWILPRATSNNTLVTF